MRISDWSSDVCSSDLVVAIGTLVLLDTLRDYCTANGLRDVRYYQAGSSEMFGGAPAPQSEATPFHPHSPYAVSKVAAHWYAVNYPESYGLRTEGRRGGKGGVRNGKTRWVREQ